MRAAVRSAVSCLLMPMCVLAEACSEGVCSADLSSSASGASMLQKSGSQVARDVTGEQSPVYVGSVPVYGMSEMHRRMDDAETSKSWVFVLKDDSTNEQVQGVCGASWCSDVGHPSDGGVEMAFVKGTFNEIENLIVSKEDVLSYVEKDSRSYATPTLKSKKKTDLWGLDRVDQRAGRDGEYKFRPDGGKGVHVYVTDTGIRVSHQDFKDGSGQQRAVNVLEDVGQGLTVCAGKTGCGDDDDGHGSHCAGTVGGNTFGVAKAASLYGVKILKKDVGGLFSWWVAAMDWIATKGRKPTIVSASMGGLGTSNYIKQAVNRAIDSGVTVVVAAGNENNDACKYQPAFVTSLINVGATSVKDERAGFSNYGSCVGIMAPGVSIASASHKGDAKTTWMHGTSMACPHVSGAAALLLQENGALTPAQVKQQLYDKSTKDTISGLKGEADRFLFVEPWTGGGPPATPAPPSPSPDTEEEMVDFDAPQNERCAGNPIGGNNAWGNLGKSESAAECKQACLQDTACKFAVYKGKRKSTCTSFASCDSTVGGRANFVIWEKVGADDSPEPEASMAPLHTLPPKHVCAGKPPKGWANLGKKKSQEQCQNLCLQDSGCLFAVLNTKSGKCSGWKECSEFQKKRNYKVWKKVPID